MHEVLYNGLQKARGMAVGAPGTCRELTGGDTVDAVALVDQAPVGRTPRANPATYVKAWDHVRRLFAGTPAARERGLSASTFSFNTAGGRCETCQGSGFEKIDMQFLSDIFVTCPDCDGARFRREVLEVAYKGRTIAEVLQLTVAQALAFFDDAPALCRALQALRDVGLDYVRLGQPLNTLSGGESQRLKLAFHMGQDEGGPAPADLRRADHPACTSTTSRRCCAPSTACWRRGTRCSSSSTTWRSSRAPTT